MYSIENNHGHFEIYKDGDFICSEDTYSDAKETIKELQGEQPCNSYLSKNSITSLTSLVAVFS